MTLPDERYRALAQIPGVLHELATTPGPVSKRDLRRLVSRLLRHYPTQHELRHLAKKCPAILQAPPEAPDD